MIRKRISFKSETINIRSLYVCENSFFPLQVSPGVRLLKICCSAMRACHIRLLMKEKQGERSASPRYHSSSEVMLEMFKLSSVSDDLNNSFEQEH